MKNYLEYKDYIGTVLFSGEDKVFYGKLEAIDDLVSFEGSTVADLEESFQEAVEDYLATCKEQNKPANKTYKGVFNVRVPEDIHKKLDLLARKNGLKLNDVVRKSLTYTVENEGAVLKEEK